MTKINRLDLDALRTFLSEHLNVSRQIRDREGEAEGIVLLRHLLSVYRGAGLETPKENLKLSLLDAQLDDLLFRMIHILHNATVAKDGEVIAIIANVMADLNALYTARGRAHPEAFPDAALS